MEILHHIKTELRIAREKKEKQKKIRSLEKLFETPEGQKYLADNLRKWNISKFGEGKIEPIDNKIREFRLMIEVDNETFIEALRPNKPEKINYKITNRRDEFDAGYLLVEVNNKIAVRTSGIIFPQAGGVEGLFQQLYDLGYRRGDTKPAPNVFQPWQEIVKKS